MHLADAARDSLQAPVYLAEFQTEKGHWQVAWMTSAVVLPDTRDAQTRDPNTPQRQQQQWRGTNSKEAGVRVQIELAQPDASGTVHAIPTLNAHSYTDIRLESGVARRGCGIIDGVGPAPMESPLAMTMVARVSSTTREGLEAEEQRARVTEVLLRTADMNETDTATMTLLLDDLHVVRGVSRVYFRPALRLVPLLSEGPAPAPPFVSKQASVCVASCWPDM